MRAAALLLFAAVLGVQLPAQEPEPIQAGVAPPPGDYAPGVDVLHYDVELGLSDSAASFAGITRVRLRLETDGAPLRLDFTGLGVQSVALRSPLARPLASEHTHGILTIPLEGFAAGDTVEVEVGYGGVPDDGLIIRDNVHGDPAVFADNWPNRARFWFPNVDHPSDKATVRFTVHAPAAWRVIANGHLVEGPVPAPPDAVGPSEQDRRTWVWQVGVPISTYNMVVGAADLEVRTVGLAACGSAPASRREDGCVEVTYWVFPEDVERAAPSFRRAAQMVDHFTETIGPFPFEKLANVQSATRFGGMENASAIFYSESGIAAGRNIESTVSHEIAHQWFGDAVTEADWHHLWLSEGFATYFGAVFFEQADGVGDFRRRMEENRLEYLESDVVDRPVVDPTVTNLFALLNANNYPKGAWVLHMLRGLVGDEAFFAGIRAYYARHLHDTALTEDFQRVMEEVSGRELGWFFEQWIHRPGYPAFEVEHGWIPGTRGVGGTAEVSIRQVQRPDWPRFRTPLELVLVHEGGEHRATVEVDGTDDVFRFELPAPPTRVIVDPDGWVLDGPVR